MASSPLFRDPRDCSAGARLRGGSASGSQSDDVLAHAEYTRQRVASIRVLQDADATEIEYDGATLVTYPHGKAQVTDAGIVAADWDRRRFIVEHELQNGTEITETYRLDDGSLHWTVRIKAKKAKPVEFSRIYARAGSQGLRFVA